MVDGVNLYRYVGNNPICLHDPKGNQGVDPDGVIRKPGTTGFTLYHAKNEVKLLPETQTTLATDLDMVIKSRIGGLTPIPLAFPRDQ
jgi:hypothetical protein